MRVRSEDIRRGCGGVAGGVLAGGDCNRVLEGEEQREPAGEQGGDGPPAGEARHARGGQGCRQGWRHGGQLGTIITAIT